jgi:hypothetical protein
MKYLLCIFMATCLGANAQVADAEVEGKDAPPKRETSYLTGYTYPQTRIPDPVLNKDFIVEWTRESIRTEDYRRLFDKLKLDAAAETLVVDVIAARNVAMSMRQLRRNVDRSRGAIDYATRIEQDEEDEAFYRAAYATGNAAVKQLLGKKYADFEAHEQALILQDELDKLNAGFEKEFVRMTAEQMDEMFAAMLEVQEEFEDEDDLERMQDQLVTQAAGILTGKQLNLYSKSLYAGRTRPEPYLKVLNIPELTMRIPLSNLEPLALDDNDQGVEQ